MTSKGHKVIQKNSWLSFIQNTPKLSFKVKITKVNKNGEESHGIWLHGLDIYSIWSEKVLLSLVKIKSANSRFS